MGNERAEELIREIFGGNWLAGGRGSFGKLVHRGITKSTGNGR